MLPLYIFYLSFPQLDSQQQYCGMAINKFLWRRVGHQSIEMHLTSLETYFINCRRGQ